MNNTPKISIPLVTAAVAPKNGFLPMGKPEPDVLRSVLARALDNYPALGEKALTAQVLLGIAEAAHASLEACEVAISSAVSARDTLRQAELSWCRSEWNEAQAGLAAAELRRVETRKLFDENLAKLAIASPPDRSQIIPTVVTIYRQSLGSDSKALKDANEELQNLLEAEGQHTRAPLDFTPATNPGAKPKSRISAFFTTMFAGALPVLAGAAMGYGLFENLGLLRPEFSVLVRVGFGVFAALLGFLAVRSIGDRWRFLGDSVALHRSPLPGPKPSLGDLKLYACTAVLLGSLELGTTAYVLQTSLLKRAMYASQISRYGSLTAAPAFLFCLCIAGIFNWSFFVGKYQSTLKETQARIADELAERERLDRISAAEQARREYLSRLEDLVGKVANLTETDAEGAEPEVQFFTRLSQVAEARPELKAALAAIGTLEEINKEIDRLSTLANELGLKIAQLEHPTTLDDEEKERIDHVATVAGMAGERAREACRLDLN